MSLETLSKEIDKLEKDSKRYGDDKIHFELKGMKKAINSFHCLPDKCKTCTHLNKVKEQLKNI